MDVRNKILHLIHVFSCSCYDNNWSATIQDDILIFSDPILPIAFLLVRGHSQRYKPGFMASSGLYLLVCFGSFPSLWLLNFPSLARWSLGCLWNGSSAGLLWEVTEKGRSAATSPLCSWRVPRGSLNGGLALLHFKLFLCVFVWEWAVFTFECWGWAFFFFFFSFFIWSRCHIELVQQSAGSCLDCRTIFFQDCPGVSVARMKGCCHLSFCMFLCMIHPFSF